MRKIVFGGSFDPVHFGHLKIADQARKAVQADKVVFLIAKYPRWKEVGTDFFHRLEMLKIALEGIPWAEISLVEYQSEQTVNYTYDSVVRMLSPSGETFFLIGSDQLNQLDRWHRIDELAKKVKIVAVRRPDFPICEANRAKYGVEIVAECADPISSSAIRDLRALNCPKSVIDYIGKNNLYYIPKIRAYLSGKRFNHSMSVADLAYAIGEANGLDAPKAYIAGLLHDIGKEIPEEEQRAFMKREYPLYERTLPKALYHQFLSETIVRDAFGIADPEILEAVCYHATGKAKMNPYARIVYASDKIEPTRGYDSGELIRAMKSDYATGFLRVLEENIRFLEAKKSPYKNPLTQSCIYDYLKRGEKI